MATRVHIFFTHQERQMARVENLLTAKQVEAALRKGAPIQLNDGGWALS